MTPEQKDNLTRAQSLLDEAKGLAESVCSELQDDYDAMEENAQDTENGQALSEDIEQLEQFVSDVDEAISYLIGITL